MSQKVFDVSGFTTYLRRYNTLPGPDFTANVQQSALCDGGRGRLDFASSFFLRVPLAGWVVQGWGSDVSFLSLSVAPLFRTGAPHQTSFQPAIVPQFVSTAHSELYRFVFFSLQNRSNKYGNSLNTSTIVILDK